MDEDDIPPYLDMIEWANMTKAYPIVRRAVAGTTVLLIAVIIEHNIWVASLGILKDVS
jgi:hypothetical protein